IGQWTYRHLKARKAAIIASDSVGPLELMMAWARAFEESGGKIVQEIYPPLGTADMAPWVAKLRQDVDVIGVQTVGADGVRFVKQFQEYGLKGKIPVVDASVGVSEISLLPTAGEAAVGVYNSQPYQYTVDTPRNRKFVQAFRAKFGRDPGSPAAFTYAAMAALDAAVNATGGHIEDSARFLEALGRARGAGMDPTRGGPARAARVAQQSLRTRRQASGALRERFEPWIDLADEHLHTLDGLLVVEESRLPHDEQMAEATDVVV